MTWVQVASILRVVEQLLCYERPVAIQLDEAWDDIDIDLWAEVSWTSLQSSTIWQLDGWWRGARVGMNRADPFLPGPLRSDRGANVVQCSL